MKKLIVNGVAGVTLFGGALVGGLAATGRLNHDGVANIPVLNSLFPPEPDAAAGEGAGEGVDGAHGAQGPSATDAHAAPVGEVSDAAHSGKGGVAADAAHASGGEQVPQGPRKTKVGQSVLNPEPPPDDGAGGGGHGGEPEAAHGEEADPDAAEHKPAAGRAADQGHSTAGANEHPSARDFTERDLALARDKANKYSPGGYFVFEGMPSGMTPEQLNEAWQRVQAVLADLEQRKVALDLREKGLVVREADISDRQLALARLREEIRNEHQRLDERIAKFKEQVVLVRSDEVAALKGNAEIYASFEPDKAAELITDQWGTEEGQAEVLKMFEFMEKDKVNEIINELANPLIQDVLRKRLRVSKEAVPSKGGRR